MERKITIGQLAKGTGIAPKTIRYYEEVGLVPPPERSRSGYRLYSETDVRRFELIKRARALDMALPEVRQLVEWASSGACGDFQYRFKEVIHLKTEQVDRRISDLLGLKRDLQRLEAHLAGAQGETGPSHTVLECSPDTCACLGPTTENLNASKEVNLMAALTGVEDITESNQKQDCGCGCGGAACGTTNNDCGCGCGGNACGSSWQKLVWLDSAPAASAPKQPAGQR
ncbi:MAG: MerR family transcriptional regulator [Chloroflexi bacterium]|nr:MerR family transcriptional regulator [Chloroflexota bacterium]